MNNNLQSVFEHVYETKRWLGKVGTLTGLGSAIECVKEYLFFLQNYVDKNNIQNIIDLGCGDFNLMQHFNFKNINYLGIDIVNFVIEENNKKYKSDNINFLHENILTYKPKIKYNLVILKDVLQHLSNKNIISLLDNIDYSNNIIIVNDITDNNYDCENGEWRGINLNLPPFNMKTEKIFEFSACDSFKHVVLLKNNL